MAQVKIGSEVKVHYTGKLENGTEFDTSRNRDPLQFTVGEGQLIPGFEQAVVGMEQGDSKTVKIPAEQAYGPRNEEMVLEVPREQFPSHIKPVVGQQLELHQADQVIGVTITEVSDNNVTLDANHPLAGEDLTFDIQLVEVV